MAASFSTGLARYALERASSYAKERTVFKAPIGSHQAVAHPLAQAHIETELARLMTQKAAALCDAGDDMGAGEAANMAKYAAAEAACHAVDAAVQTHGGNGITQEYGMAGLLVAARAGRIAPGEPGDDPQLRRDAQPGAAEVLLSRTPHAFLGPSPVTARRRDVGVAAEDVRRVAGGLERPQP